MQLINHQYHSLEKLELFLTTLLSIPHQSLFVQFFSGTTDKSILQPVLDYLSAHLPNINLIGATTAGEILDGSISDSGIIIAFHYLKQPIFLRIIIQRRTLKMASAQH